MKVLVVGAGALGGLVAARMIAAGERVAVATRNEETAATLRAGGLRVSGIGGDVAVELADVAPLAAYETATWDWIVLATKAHDAIAVAPRLRGRVLPIQNGAVAEILGESLGGERVCGALSNLGATMHAPGVYEQRNSGHLLIDAKGAEIADWLARGVSVRTTPSFRGAVWSKLLLNCAVTTVGAVAGEPMRSFVERPAGAKVFRAAYAEALAVARASGAAPERMIVDPLMPTDDAAYDRWVLEILAAYGDLKASMLQDIERGRRTEVDFINGHVVRLGDTFGIPTPVNARIVEAVHALERRELAPTFTNLEAIVA